LEIGSVREPGKIFENESGRLIKRERESVSEKEREREV
jgi:hypothetical protein